MALQRFCAAALAVILLSSYQYPSQQAFTSYPSQQAFTSRASDAGADLEIIRQRVIADLIEPPLDEQEIRSMLKSITKEGSWPDIDYKDVSRTGFQHSKHLLNMFELSRAYKKPGSPWFQHPEVKEVALSSLDFWLQHDFICDNWWWNEMGTPGRMINTLLVLDADLNEKQIREGLRIAGRANLEASGARPGGDLIQIAGMLGKQALFRRDATVLERVVSVMANEIKVTDGRGLKPDMSFHHRVDNVICTLSYGLGYADAFAYWAVKISGTKFKFPAQATNLLIDYFLDGICKSMVYGKYPDPGAKNRDLSRKGTLHPAGPQLAENLLQISDYRKPELEEIISIRKDEKKPGLMWNRFFWHSEYFTHQRPTYFSSVRMHSSRNHTMEQPHNEEGLKMHHVGDGSNFISQSGKEYLDIFPVWDWQKIPGTTVVQKPVHPHWNDIAKKGLTDFVGGVSDGLYGAAVFDFKSAHDPLSARKAWFYFDDEYVCLGAGITAQTEHTVVTTLNQCLLNTNVVVKSKKGEAVVEKGNHTLPHISWVYHDGVGYVFPESQKINIGNTTVTGNWRDINHQASSSSQPVTREVFSLWLDHGSRPQGAQYAYIVVPSTESNRLGSYIKNSPLKILANTDAVQAVVHNTLKRGYAVFYTPGEIRINDNVSIGAASPCVVMVKTNGKGIEQIAVSDPTRKLETLELTTNVPVEGKGSNWQASRNLKNKSSLIKVDLPRGGDAGKSVVMSLVGF